MTPAGLPSFSLDHSKNVCFRIRSQLQAQIDLLRQRQAHQDGHAHELAALLFEQYSLFGRLAALEEAISIYRGLLAAKTVPDRLPPLLEGLADSLRARYEQLTDVADITEAIALFEKSLALRSESGTDRYPALHGLAVALYTRSIATRHTQPDDDGRAVRLLRQALEILAPGSVRRPRTLAYLSFALVSAANSNKECIPAVAMFLEAISAAPPDHPDHALCLAAGAWSLAMTYTVSDASQHGATLNLIRYACDLTASMGHPRHPRCLISLAYVLRYQSQGSGSDLKKSLHESLETSRRAYRACSERHMSFYGAGTGFTATLSEAYYRTDNLDYLDEQITASRHIIKAVTDRPYRPLFHNFADALEARYQLTEREEDLAEALAISEQCIAPIADPPHIGEVLYMRMAALLRLHRFRRFGDVADVNAAIEFYRRSLPCFPAMEWTHTMAMITTAVDALQTRFSYTLQFSDLHEAIELARTFLGSIPPSSLRRHALLDGLATSQRLLGKHLRQIPPIEEAIAAHQEALALVPETHSLRSRLQAGLAGDYACLWQLSRNPDALDASMAHFEAAVADRLGPPHARLRHAIAWCEAAADAAPPVRSAAFRAALALLARVVLFGGDLKSQLEALRHSPAVARDAAMHALARRQPDQAVEWLEQGRAVCWSRALSARQPLHGLPDAVVAQLTDVSRQLEKDHGEDQRVMARRQSLVDQFDALVERVRGTPGNEYFLHAQPLEKLRLAAEKGPIVVLVADRSSARAIILRCVSAGAESLDLGMDVGILERLSNSLFIENEHARKATPEGEVRKMRKVHVRPILHRHDDILLQLWVSIVKPVVIALGLQSTTLEARPRVFWCPTGPFAFLPIHAAGAYLVANPECASDYMVSSYTPTITALLTARHDPPRAPLTASSAAALLVAEPETEFDAARYKPLPNTLDEVARVHALLPGATVLQEGVGVARALAHLPDAAVLHLACHGRADAADPRRSGFVLRDGVLQLGQLMELRPRNAAFAFLSACESAMGDKKLPDETMHLAAAMMFIGYRSVVGTLWSMNDADGPRIAQHVYRELLENSAVEFNYEAIPRALDAAVRKLREDGAHPSRWATWIHMGI